MHRYTSGRLIYETLRVLCLQVNLCQTGHVQELVNHVLAGAAHVLRDRRAELALEALYVDAQRAADEQRSSGDAGDFGFGCSPGVRPIGVRLDRTAVGFWLLGDGAGEAAAGWDERVAQLRAAGT